MTWGSHDDALPALLRQARPESATSLGFLGEQLRRCFKRLVGVLDDLRLRRRLRCRVAVIERR
jgi:hypothetical protein